MTLADLEVGLPEHFTVVAAADPSLVEVPQVPDELQEWWAGVQAAQAAAGADLVALGVQVVGDAPAVVSLALKVLPLSADPQTSLAGLRAIALAETSVDGEVSLLSVPGGEAVAAADVVHGPDGEPAARVVVHLVLPAVRQSVTLTLVTASPAHLPLLAALAVQVAAGVRPPDEEAADAPAR